MRSIIVNVSRNDDLEGSFAHAADHTSQEEDAVVGGEAGQNNSEQPDHDTKRDCKKRLVWIGVVPKQGAGNGVAENERTLEQAVQKLLVVGVLFSDKSLNEIDASWEQGALEIVEDVGVDEEEHDHALGDRPLQTGVRFFYTRLWFLFCR